MKNKKRGLPLIGAIAIIGIGTLVHGRDNREGKSSRQDNAKFRHGGPPSPAESKEINVFVGYYGEVIEFSLNEKAWAHMRGPIEDVRIYPKTLSAKPDFNPRNFQSLGLNQLLVIPKGLPHGYRQLSELIAAKKAELEKQRHTGLIHYDIKRPSGHLIWPKESREFVIENLNPLPFTYWQIYSQSPHEFFIWNTGIDPTVSKGPDMDSLARYLMDRFPAPPLTRRQEIWRDITYASFRAFASFITHKSLRLLLVGRRALLFFNLIFLSMIFLSYATKRSKLRAAGILLLTFSNAFAAFAFFTLLAAQSQLLNSPRSAFFICVEIAFFATIAFLCWFFARLWQAKNMKTVLLVSFVLIAYLAWVHYYGSNSPLGWDYLDVFGSSIINVHFLEGIAIAITLFLTLQSEIPCERE